MKLSVIIPAFNERETICELLDRVEKVQIDKEIIVVDDCSTDGTRELLESLNRSSVRVLYHDMNQGKGAAVRTGIKNAQGEYVVVQDADLEYDPEEYHLLFGPIEKGEADVVYGSRFRGKLERMTLIQEIGNRFLTTLTNVLYGTTLTDMETCYKLIPTRVVSGIELHSRGFEFEPEITAKLLKKKCRIVEVPITYVARDAEAGKKIDWRHGWPALKTLLKYRVRD